MSKKKHDPAEVALARVAGRGRAPGPTRVYWRGHWWYRGRDSLTGLPELRLCEAVDISRIREVWAFMEELAADWKAAREQ